MSIDLSKVNPNSMVSVLENNKDLLWSQTDKNSLIKTVESIFSENKINTKASNRLILNMNKSRDLTSALITLTNSMLAGYAMSLNN